MPITSLAVLNHDPTLSMAEVDGFVKALDLQFRVDFQPHWGRDVVVFATRSEALLAPRTWKLHLHPGSALGADGGALGRHGSVGPVHVPEGHVFLQSCRDNSEPWTEIASHEALEMAADEWLNLIVPRKVDGAIELWPREVCDAVQGSSYELYGVQVSNFVYPEYFVEGSDGPFDKLGLLKGPFTVLDSGYSAVTVVTGPKIELVNRYGGAYPAWRRQVRSLSRKFLRLGG